LAEPAGVTAAAAPESAPEPSAVFLRACRGLPVEHTPVWLLRQAGRYQPEYRALRERHSMLELIRTPELAAQVTLQPIESFGLDAAIIFADILPPLVGMGLELDFVQGEGPRIANRISGARDVDLLGTPPAEETMAGTLEAIAIVRGELEARDVPVIGFAGAPFTLASYAIEGGTSRDFSRTKGFMLSEPAAWKRLLGKLVTVQADYLLAQVKAGAQALQVFDSWAGRALGRQDYLHYVAPANRELFEKVVVAGVPVVNFSLGVGAYLEDAVACGGDVVGLDWQLPLDEAWERVGLERPVQGNLDPASLLAPWRELRARIDDVLERAGRRPGHVFNVGHGLVPQTPTENLDMTQPVGVLVMAYGGPESLDELPGYLADIRHGRPTPRAVLDEITENYRAIGGRSPLREITERQVTALQDALGPDYRCYLGMRHWSPWIEEVVGRMVDDGVERAIGLVLAPQFSALSVARYQQKVGDGLELHRSRIEFRHVASYHDAPGLIAAFAARLRDGLARWPEDERERVHVVFSAHSLPVRVLAGGDPYETQCRETGELVAARVGLTEDRWSWSWQSAGRSAEPWAGPDLGDHLADVADRGVRDVVSLPVGFVSDHVELLYDVDVRARRIAEEVGIRLERPPALNDDPVFVETLADLIRARADGWVAEARAA
jgi:uroporphyrinogen decarboxylase/ferrochelatase